MREKWGQLNKFTKNTIICLCFVIILGVAFYGILLSVVLYGSVDQVNGEPEIMIVLGCQVMEWGPSQSLEDRLLEALDFLEEFPNMVIIVSGGQGSNEPTTEAKAMADFLVTRGVAEERIYQEGKSRNTHQNLSFSRTLMEEEGLTGDVVIVSSGFHLARASFLWGRVGGEPAALSVVAAPVTDGASWVKSHLREPLALVKSFLFDHGQVEVEQS